MTKELMRQLFNTARNADSLQSFERVAAELLSASIADTALTDERDRLLRALAPFARVVATDKLSWAMVEYCIEGDPEKQTFSRPQMQRAFNRAAETYSLLSVTASRPAIEASIADTAGAKLVTGPWPTDAMNAAGMRELAAFHKSRGDTVDAIYLAMSAAAPDTPPAPSVADAECGLTEERKQAIAASVEQRYGESIRKAVDSVADAAGAKHYERHDPENATAPFLSFIPDAKRDELIGALLASLERNADRETDFYTVRSFIGGLGLLAAQFAPKEQK